MSENSFFYYRGIVTQVFVSLSSPTSSVAVLIAVLFACVDVYKHFVTYGHKVSEAVGRTVINWEEVSVCFRDQMRLLIIPVMFENNACPTDVQFLKHSSSCQDSSLVFQAFF